MLCPCLPEVCFSVSCMEGKQSVIRNMCVGSTLPFFLVLEGGQNTAFV